MSRNYPPGDPTLISRTLQMGERDGTPVAIVSVRRSYDTDVDDLWDALTDPARLARWFLPVTGDLREGGRYQLEGNAGGTITRCVAPERIEATWEVGGGVSWIEVFVSGGPDGATMTLVHTSPVVPGSWDQYGPGAAGVGWDLALDALATYALDPDHGFDEEAYVASHEGRRFIAASSERWGEAAIAAGTDPVVARAAAARSTAFFSGTTEPGG